MTHTEIVRHAFAGKRVLVTGALASWVKQAG